ncbi:hypothetical protein KYJ26_11645 [Bacillus sp. MCCB 382]|uniref:hypothetical protein n=1 Tax=Bacillus sp. MCCB 382 TaxID=2860197 RepID=UPI001C58FE54|nr:hypothetical protein [Bacillus sp. MCCB 382]
MVWFEWRPGGQVPWLIDDEWGGIGMLVTEYAKGSELDFRIESLKVYGVLMGLLGEERERREDGYGLVSYRELWEGCKGAGVLSGVDMGFAVMMDMVGVLEDGGLIWRERVSGGALVEGMKK